MSQTGIEKSRGTLILGLIDRHRHTTDRCTNPTNTEKKRLHRTRESLGFEIISTNSPNEGQGGGIIKHAHLLPLKMLSQQCTYCHEKTVSFVK